MKIFPCSKIKHIDAYTIEHEPILSVDLMERAATALLQRIVTLYPYPEKFCIFAGPGNNGGDGVALARMLIQIGYNVSLYILHSKNYSEDLRTNINRVSNQGIIAPVYISSDADFPFLSESSIVIDALFGSGLSRPLEGIAARLVEHINSSKVRVVSVDIPSGLFGEDNTYPNHNPAIKAMYTLTLQFPKLSFIFPENHPFVGEWELIDIGLHKKIVEELDTAYHFVDFNFAKGIYRRKDVYSHKGSFGHALIISGSFGMMGAAVLCVNACLRAGAGLVTAQIPGCGYSIIQSQAPEALVQLDSNSNFFSEIPDLTKYSSVTIGPGLGQHDLTVDAFKNLISHVNVPLVIDADGLNILARDKDLLKMLPANTVLTPHVGEFNRLFGQTTSGCERLKRAIEMATLYKLNIIIKGAFTQVVSPSGRVYINSTGNPGLATGGSGDVLTGIISGLLAQGYFPEHASILGVFIHGLAADKIVRAKSQTSLVATSLLSAIGEAFRVIER
jgi:NAD(P)H-hydrate epimerase